MENNSEFMKKVELYVEDIISKCAKEVNNAAYGKHQEQLPSDKVNNSSKLDKNATDSVTQFADRLAGECLKEGVQKGQDRQKMKRILCVGIVALDFVYICEKFPVEDEKTMATGHSMSRGGNAANTATVLAHLGTPAEYFGTIVKNQWADLLQGDFRDSGVNIDNCVHLDQDKHKTPIATLILSQKTGSRSAVVDFVGITGPTSEQFANINLANYTWVHLESRCFDGRPKDLEYIMNLVNKYNDSSKAEDKVTLSLELEQPPSTNPAFVNLLPKADIVFIGKEYATGSGYMSKEEAVKELSKKCRKGATVVCAWGSDGAAAMSGDQLVCSSAFPPKELIDTLGAGDTFNASVIYSLNRGKSNAEAIEFACKVAGYKCGHRGFSCVKDMQNIM